MGFVEDIAPLVQKYAKEYGIGVCSPIIAQGVLESQSGKSELGVNAMNFFGMKYRKGRVPCASGVYYKVGSEQNKDGTYVSSNMKWLKFNSYDSAIHGYFQFINVPNYANLKGVTDPRRYLELIKKDGYATSLKYVDNLMAVIDKYNLTKYDEVSNMDKVKVILDVGHGINTSGKRCMKALDPNETREWWLSNRIARKLQVMLENTNAEVYRVDDITGKTNVSLYNRVRLANKYNGDVYISIHENAGVNGGKGGGTTVYFCSSNPTRLKQATDLYDSLIAQTGLVGNRASKVINKGFYVLKYTKMPAFLTENGFMDSATDVPIILTDDFATKTAIGMFNMLVKDFGVVDNVKQATVTTPSKEVVTIELNPYAEPTKLVKKNYKRGIKPSNDIKWVQWELKQDGYDILVDGYFGSGTEKIVKDFQAKHGLVADGIVGSITRKAFKLV